MRQGAEVLPESPRIGPLHEGRPHPKSAESHAERTVVRGLAPSPVSSLLLAIGCSSSAGAGWGALRWVCGRALECGCFPVGYRGDQGPVRC